MNALVKVATALTIVGGLNWGLVGFFDYNLVDEIFGEGSGASRVVYSIVGVAAVVTIAELFSSRRVVRR